MELSRFGIEAETSTKQRAYGVENNSKERNLILLGVVLFWHKKREREKWYQQKKASLSPIVELVQEFKLLAEEQEERNEILTLPCKFYSFGTHKKGSLAFRNQRKRAAGKTTQQTMKPI